MANALSRREMVAREELCAISIIQWLDLDAIRKGQKEDSVLRDIIAKIEHSKAA